MTGSQAYLLSSRAAKPTPIRPAGKQQPSLGAYDPDDPGGAVSRSCPPEQLMPLDMWRGDFGCVTINQDPASVPLVPGCNTTPQNAMISFLLPFYNRQWQDIQLTEHCWRSYTYLHLDRVNADRAGLSATQFVQLMAYVQSWGFRTSYWGMGTPDGQQDLNGALGLLMPTINALVAAGPTVSSKATLLFCEETNSCMSPATLDALVVAVAPICKANGIRMRHHFTSRYPAWPTEGMSNVDFWARQSSLGVEGLCYQAIPTDPAGTMMAAMWDTRGYMGRADINLKLTAFELRAEEQLFGRKNEQDGCRTGLEATFATRGSTNYPAVDGYGNGGCRIDGTTL
jgi:hypothetical protein